MAQIILNALTTLNLGTHLDPMFTELYQLRNALGPVSGRLVASSHFKVTASAETSQDVSVKNTVLGSTTLGFMDSTRTANNRMAEILWSAGALRGRFLDDAYSTAREWFNVTGGQASGVTGIYFGGHTQPASDNTTTLGSAVFRWSVVYAGTGAINTSDAREKTAVVPLMDAEVRAACRLAREVGGFQFLASISEKGSQVARRHIGMTVQRAMQVMSEEGLDPLRYAFICRDAWGESRRTEPAFTRRHPLLLSDDGHPLMEEIAPAREIVTPAGDRYGFRVDQLLLFIARGLAAQQDRIEQRLQALEAAS